MIKGTRVVLKDENGYDQIGVIVSDARFHGAPNPRLGYCVEIIEHEDEYNREAYTDWIYAEYIKPLTNYEIKVGDVVEVSHHHELYNSLIGTVVGKNSYDCEVLLIGYNKPVSLTLDDLTIADDRNSLERWLRPDDF